MGSTEFRDRVAALGREVDEDAWAMPLPPGLRTGLDSTLADIANVAGAPWGLTPTGGTGVPVRTIVATLESICAQRP